MITKNRFIKESDLNKDLQPYGIVAHWIPDTLFQLMQIAFYQDKDKPTNMPWSTAHGSGNYFNRNHKLSLRNEIFTSFPDGYYRINDLSIENGWTKKSNSELLNIAFETLPHSSIKKDGKLEKHISIMLQYKTMFEKIINTEGLAYKNASIVLWRYTNGVEKAFLDIVMDKNKLLEIKDKREIKFWQKSGLSYAYTILAGIVNDSMITPNIRNESTSACTFSFLCTNILSNEDFKNPFGTLYYLTINTSDLTEDHSIRDHYVYLPALSFDQDIFGFNEMFHPRWFWDPSNLERKLEEAHETREDINKKLSLDQNSFMCDHSKRMSSAGIIYTQNNIFEGNISEDPFIVNHKRLINILSTKGICSK